jgi:hypothetical protein
MGKALSSDAGAAAAAGASGGEAPTGSTGLPLSGKARQAFS